MKTKVVRSGQVRLYYAADCLLCGWTGPFRVTRERAWGDMKGHNDEAH